MGDAPRGADCALPLRAELNPLQLKMLLERMNRAVAPNDIVLIDRVEVFGALGQSPRDRVEHEARVERSDERDVDDEPGGILDLGDRHAVDLLALRRGHEVDLADALAERGALQESFEAGETTAVGRPVGESLAANAPGEDAADDEGGAVPGAEVVDGVARRLVVGRE